MMIVQLTGSVTYSITLDPTVWIFDDRKVLLDEAFQDSSKEKTEKDEIKNAAERFARETFIKPPVNKSISRFEKEKILVNSYVMPIEDFLKTAEIHNKATEATLVTSQGEVTISLEQLQKSLLLFAKDGKPLKDNGPVHLYFGDGSNQDSPITAIKKIIIE